MVIREGAQAAADCAFCQIVAGRLESSQVHADEDVIAFMDIRPATAGHLLVVPRTHAAGLTELSAELGERMFAVGHRLALALRQSGVPCEGVNLFLADGEVAGQEVFHVHLHVLPRSSGDGFGLRASFRSPGRAELDATAGRIRQAAASPR